MAAGRQAAEAAAGGGALLVIGVHREELAFGEGVAALLAGQGDLRGLEVLRIGDGITGRHPRSDQRYRYELQHRAIYRQIRERAVRYRLLIDLHRGDDDHGPCADVISADAGLLSCVRQRAAARLGAGGATLRTVQITADGRPPAAGATPAHTVIPPQVWDSHDFLFVGLEVYLPTAGSGGQRDWRFGADLVACIMACAAA